MTKEELIKSENSIPWLQPVLLLGGLIWIGRALQEFYEPNYWNPVTTCDYIAVVGTSLQMLFLSAVFWGLYRLFPLPASGKQKVWMVGMAIIILASATAGVSNFIEDALGVKTLGFIYGIGSFGLILGYTLAEIGALMHSNIRSRMGGFLLACFVGVGFPDYGSGIVAGFGFWVMAWDLHRHPPPMDS